MEGENIEEIKEIEDIIVPERNKEDSKILNNNEENIKLSLNEKEAVVLKDNNQPLEREGSGDCESNIEVASVNLNEKEPKTEGKVSDEPNPSINSTEKVKADINQEIHNTEITTKSPNDSQEIDPNDMIKESQNLLSSLKGNFYIILTML